MAIPVLVVDDDITHRTAVVIMLGREGITADSAANGLEAVSRVRQYDYDLILMDGTMPEMDGYVTTAAIRYYQKENNKKPMPIVGLMAEPDMKRALDSGMNDVIKKPIPVPELKRLLARWLKK